MADTETQEAQQEAPPEPASGEGDSVEVQDVDLPEAADQPAGGPGGQIGMLLDAAMPLSVRLGRVSLQVRELLQLGPGSVLKLDKQVGEPAEIFLRDALFASGHLVVVGDRLGIRIKDVLSPNEIQDEEPAPA